ncbi:MAG: beta-propeller domain-containing protein [Myxococcales bacterium]|nr:beta-propeller domain-containing protein [Myxococcales bacterium]
MLTPFAFHTLRTCLLSLALCTIAMGCGSGDYASESSASDAPSESGGVTPAPSPSTSDDAKRALAEADIIQLRDGILYAMSKSGTVSIVDVSEADQLTLLGQTEISGVPFEMYLRGPFLVAMVDDATDLDGLSDGATTPTPNGAAIMTLDVQVPLDIRTVSTLAVPGDLADSRLVGDILYLATYEDIPCYGCNGTPRTLVTSFDVTDPGAITQVDQASFASNAPNTYSLAWGSHWKRSIFVNGERLYIGGHADLDPDTFYEGGEDEGIIDVVDISAPDGRMHIGARLRVAGAVLSRWQMDEHDGMLRVISQAGAGRTGNGLGDPQIDIFRIDSTDSFEHIGHTSLSMPRQEGLRTVRFDSDRAYAITYNQTDPMFVIDLQDPTEPTQRGELEMPGFMFYLEPYGDRVIGLGIDRDDPEGSINVSLFDVGDMDAPTMLGRVSFASTDVYEDYQILNAELPEDQDRIQKAFRVFDDGLVAVPFSSPAGCGDPSSGVQLVNWSGDTLTKGVFLPVPGNPRRAFQNEGNLLAVSDSTVRVFEIPTQNNAAVQKADLTIGTCVQKDPYYNDYGEWGDFEGDYGHGYDDYYPGCSVLRSPHGADWSAAPLALFALIALRRRRRSRTEP